jgi:hypothetical protein
MAALGNLAFKILGIIGGLLAIAIGLIWMVFGFVAYTSVHIGSAGGMLSLGGAAIFALFGLLAIYSIVVYDKKPRLASKLLLLSGISGFYVGYVVDYAVMGGILGLISWAVPGTLMIAAGLISWITPEKLGSTLPLLNDDRRNIRLLAKIMYAGLITGLVIMMMGILLISGAMILGIQEEGKSDSELISEAMGHESYSQYDSALSVYDRIIARNESNAEAWMRRSHALEKLGRYNESEMSRKRALQLKAAGREETVSLNKS